jgi:hypothetical protein
LVAGASFVAEMKAADLGDLHDAASCQRLLAHHR